MSHVTKSRDKIRTSIFKGTRVPTLGFLDNFLIFQKFLLLTVKSKVSYQRLFLLLLFYSQQLCAVPLK